AHRPPGAPAPEPQPEPPARSLARPAPVPPKVVKPIPAPPAPQAAYVLVSQSQMAGAITAGDGPGGGLSGSGAASGQGLGAGGGGDECSMVRRLEAALRRDRDVTAAVRAASNAADARGRALHVWDGDWVMTPGESGKGLAGVRQAIAMEVAFAPEACRRDPVRGLVLLSLADGPAAPRVALGAGTWRWADLLRP
ncbi:MAG: hypothetical protein H2041_12100, partial [Phenylobacterium sp.]|nr:hypothetical protein [Phenylobacterium sp.]